MAATGKLVRYRFVSRLGAGGMATVVLAEDTLLGRQVALKRLSAAADPRGMLRLRREALAGASISHHNLVSIYDVIDDEAGDLVIVMEYVEGQTLRQALDSRGRLPVPEALRILEGVAAGLDSIHRQGIVHRDVKPSNILLGDDGAVKVADLGIASVPDRTRITTTGSVLGSLSYMSPEQLADRPSTPAIDVYALAAVSFEILSGRKARRAPNAMALAHAIATQPPPDLRDAWAAAPPGVAELLKRGMARDPEARPRSAGELFGRLRAGLDPSATANAPLPQRTRELSPGSAAPPTKPSGTSRRLRPMPLAPATQPTAAPPKAQPTAAPPHPQPTAAPAESRPTAAPSNARPTAAPPEARPTAAPRQAQRAAATTSRRHDPENRAENAVDRPPWRRWTPAAALLALVAAAAIAVLVSSAGSGPSGQTRASTGRGSALTGSRSKRRRASGTTTAAAAGSTSATTAGASSTTGGANSTTGGGSSTTGSGGSTTGAAASSPGGSSGAATPPAGGPVAAVESFYTLAAAHQYPAAWALADPTFRAQLGGYDSFQGGQSGDKSITFHTAQIVSRSSLSTTVSVRTTSVRTDGTHQCSGTVEVSPDGPGGRWLVHMIQINCS